MSGQLDGRVALVTGGTRGLGRAIADAFLREGARVMVTGRGEEKGRQALADFGAGGAAGFVAGDVTRQADFEHAVEAAIARHGRIDILVNNAGERRRRSGQCRGAACVAVNGQHHRLPVPGRRRHDAVLIVFAAHSISKEVFAMTTPAVHTRQASLRPIPGRTGDLSAPWLTAALRSGGLDVEVARFRATEFAEGAGMMSRLVRVELDYAGGAGPPSVVVKLPTPNEANLAVSAAYHLYRRETLFYLGLAARTPARTAGAFYADLDGETDFVLLLEDLSGYHIGNQITGCTVEQARACMPFMAQLHASFWGKVDHADFDFIPYHYPSFQSDNLYQGTVAVWDKVAELAGDALPGEITKAKPAFLAAIPGMQEWITAHPRTIVHGDFRMDNLFFGQRDGDAPVVIVDWQGTLRGKGAHDLAYFLSQSMPVADRRVNERDLVARWHAGLTAGGVPDYSADQAWQDYQRAALYLWTYVVVIAGSLDPTNERGRGWMREMVTRSAATILDLGLLDLLPEFGG